MARGVLVSAPPVSLTDQIKDVEREIALREKLYPGWVSQKRLTAARADHQLACMRAVLRTLREVRAGTPGPSEDLFRGIEP